MNIMYIHPRVFFPHNHFLLPLCSCKALCLQHTENCYYNKVIHRQLYIQVVMYIVPYTAPSPSTLPLTLPHVRIQRGTVKGKVEGNCVFHNDLIRHNTMAGSCSASLHKHSFIVRQETVCFCTFECSSCRSFLTAYNLVMLLSIHSVLERQESMCCCFLCTCVHLSVVHAGLFLVW